MKKQGGGRDECVTCQSDKISAPPVRRSRAEIYWVTKDASHNRKSETHHNKWGRFRNKSETHRKSETKKLFGLKMGQISVVELI